MIGIFGHKLMVAYYLNDSHILLGVIPHFFVKTAISDGNGFKAGLFSPIALQTYMGVA